jgi:hypothetical protein
MGLVLFDEIGSIVVRVECDVRHEIVSLQDLAIKLPWVRSGADTRVPPHLILRMYGLPVRWALACRPLMKSMASSMSETCLKGYRTVCSIDMISLVVVVVVVV